MGTPTFSDSEFAWAQSKPKLRFDEQIAYLEAKGVRFSQVSPDEAQRFLQDEFFYSQLSPVMKLFSRLPDGSYIDLDFAWVIELMHLDARLGKLALEAALDIEHACKLELLQELNQRDDEDGYALVNDWWDSLTKSQKKALRTDFEIHALRNTLEASPWLGKAYLDQLLDAYELGIPLWQLLQLSFFATMVELYDFCAQRWQQAQMMGERTLLNDVKALRNAGAHGTTLLDGLAQSDNHKTAPKLEAALATTQLNETDPLSCRRVREFCSLFIEMDRFGVLGSSAHEARWLELIEELERFIDKHPEERLITGRLGYLCRAYHALVTSG